MILKGLRITKLQNTINSSVKMPSSSFFMAAKIQNLSDLAQIFILMLAEDPRPPTVCWFYANIHSNKSLRFGESIETYHMLLI